MSHLTRRLLHAAVAATLVCAWTAASALAAVAQYETFDRYDEGIDAHGMSDDGNVVLVDERFIKRLDSGATTEAVSPMFGAQPVLSGNGRYVVFSSADALVSGDTNGVADVFLRDVQAGVTERISVDSAGAQATGGSGGGSVSADGRFVAFSSSAPNLVAGDTNNVEDVFLRDRAVGTTVRVSVGFGGQGVAASSAPQVSSDGRQVFFVTSDTTFDSTDTNLLPDVYVWGGFAASRVTGDARGAPLTVPFTRWSASADGEHVAVETTQALTATDLNGAADVYVTPVLGRGVELISRTQTGAAGNGPSATGSTRGSGSTPGIALSPDGRYALFSSDASNLIPGDTNGSRDVFVRDRQAAATTRVSVDRGGGQITGLSNAAAMSADAGVVAFSSNAPVLAPEGNPDVGHTYLSRRDTRAPDTTITSGTASPISDSTPTFAFSSTDAAPSFQCRVDGLAYAPCTSPYTTAPLADGPHSFEVRSSDPSGNTDGTPASASVTIDTMAPRAILDTHPGERTAKTTPAFRFHATEAGATFECRLDSGDYRTCTSGYRTTSLRAGAHTFAVRALDAVGNREARGVSFAFERLRATREFNVSVKPSRRGRVGAVTLLAPRKGTTVVVTCLKRCGTLPRMLVRRKAVRAAASLRLKLRRPARAGTWLEIRVTDPGRISRFKAFSTDSRGHVHKHFAKLDCLDGRTRIVCPSN